MLKKLSILVACFAVLAFVAPRAASAQQNGALWISSSMKAQCLDVNCLQVEFTLEVGDPTQQIWVSWFSLKSTGTAWRFDDVLSIEDSDGNPLTPNTIVSSDSIRVENYSIGTEPLKIVVQMAASSSEQTLNGLDYAGFGNENAWLDGEDYVFTGSVVPEPVTMVLLGSGLLGLGGVGLRRRRKDQDVT